MPLYDVRTTSFCVLIICFILGCFADRFLIQKLSCSLRLPLTLDLWIERTRCDLLGWDHPYTILVDVRYECDRLQALQRLPSMIMASDQIGGRLEVDTD